MQFLLGKKKIQHDHTHMTLDNNSYAAMSTAGRKTVYSK